MRMRSPVPPIRSRSILVHWYEQAALRLAPPTSAARWLDTPVAQEALRRIIHSPHEAAAWFDRLDLGSPERRAWAYARWGGGLARLPLDGPWVTEIVQWAVHTILAASDADPRAAAASADEPGAAERVQAMRALEVRSQLAATTATPMDAALGDGLLRTALAVDVRLGCDVLWLFARGVPATAGQVWRYADAIPPSPHRPSLALRLALHPAAAALWDRLELEGIPGDAVDRLLRQHPAARRHARLRTALLTGRIPLSAPTALVIGEDVTVTEAAQLITRVVEVPGGVEAAITILADLAPEVRQQLTLSRAALERLGRGPTGDDSGHGSAPAAPDAAVPIRPWPCGPVPEAADVAQIPRPVHGWTPLTGRAD